MPQIKVKAENYASDGLVEEVLNIANNNTPSGMIPKAEVVRDADGKVVQVLVNLPTGIDAPGLANAAAKIAEHSGVAGTTPYPQDSVVNFDNLVEDQPVTQIAINNAIVNDFYLDTGNFVGSSSANAAGGVGHALEWRDTVATSGNGPGQGLVHSGWINFHATTFGLPSIGAFKMKFKMKTGENDAQANDFSVFSLMADSIPWPGIQCYNQPSASGGNNHWAVRIGNTSTTQTQILATDFHEFEFLYGLDGIIRLSIDGVEVVSYNVGYVQSSQTIQFLAQGVRYTANQLAESMFFDDMSFSILS